MGKTKKDDDELKKLKKLKKLLGEDKLRQELEKDSGKQERKKSKKKSRNLSSEEVWEEKEVDGTHKSEDNSKNQNGDKSGDKLQWMYKNSDDLVDTEDYLLGKKVDQAIVRKQMGKTAEKSEDATSSVGAIFDSSESTQAVDMANKLREDPLFMIKQQELNKKKDLLNNPVRMKQLQQLLQKSKQSKKKKKKHKKKRNESSSEDSADSDDAKSRRLMTSKQTQRDSDTRHSKYEGGRRGNSPHRKPDSHYRDKDRDNYRHRSPIKRQRSPDRSRSSQMSRSRSPRNRSSGSAKKMDAKELERRRAEMMDNAKARDEDRRNRVQRYRDEDHAEREAEKNKSHKAEFVEPMKLAASSVEDRIKRNIYNIQRTSAALDKNFAKR